ncbi:MAG: putative Rossmann fold nucleotide-binding protein [Ignavibacteria bacterium]|nr:putative Rossmann fold nucleotide-binding protein [Ignavibacteria bacterium]
MPVVSIFGSSHFKPDSLEYEDAQLVGKLLADAGFDIATGGYGGIMEAALKGANGTNVKRFGVTSKIFTSRTKNPFVSDEIIKDTYLDRTYELINLADAYIVLPGGTGTLLELAAIWALKEKKIMKDKPLVCIGDQWNEVIQTMEFYSDAAIDQFELIEHVDSGEEAVRIIIRYFNKD